jgi:radical SAM protein with 4Fe4S-binding SPASM domain
MTEAANIELDRARTGLPIRLTNLAVALKQLHRGAASPYPCGAGGGYFSVAADGRWYACHCAVGADRFRMGDNTGLDAGRRRAFLLGRHVHAQESCGACWARICAPALVTRRCAGALRRPATSSARGSISVCAPIASSPHPLCPALKKEPRDEWIDQRETPAS